MGCIPNTPCWGRPDELLADELRPTDDEDHLGLQGTNGLEALLRVDVGNLDQLRVQLSSDIVERHLTGALRLAPVLEA